MRLNLGATPKTSDGPDCSIPLGTLKGSNEAPKTKSFCYFGSGVRSRKCVCNSINSYPSANTSFPAGWNDRACYLCWPGICYSIFKFLPGSDTQTPVGFRGSSLNFVLSRKFVVLLIQIRHINFFGRVLLLVLVRCLRFISRINSVSGTYLTPFRCHVGWW